MLITENSTFLTDTISYSLQNITEALTHNVSTSSAKRPAWMDMALLSDDQVKIASQIQSPLKYIFIALAVPCALCNVIIFSRRDMSSTSAIYILGLNAGQLFYVVSYAVYDIWAALEDEPYKHLLYCLYGSYIAFFGGVFVALRASYMVLCLASVERLYAVLRPLHVKSFVLCRHPKRCVLSVYAMCAAWHAVSYLPATHVIMGNDVRTGQMVCKIVPNELYFENRFFYAFGTAGRAIFTYSCLALQLLLNVLTIWALRRHNIAITQIHSISKASSDQTRLKQASSKVCSTKLATNDFGSRESISKEAATKTDSNEFLHANTAPKETVSVKSASYEFGSTKTSSSEAGSKKFSSTNKDAKRQQERQLTIILLCVSVSYVALSLPSALFNVFVTTYPEFSRWGKYSNLYTVMSDFSYNMTVVGCGVDFCCYLALSSKFRAAIAGMFRRENRKQAPEAFPTDLDSLSA